MKNVTIGADEISTIHPLIHYVTMTANDQAGPGTQLLTNKREIKVRKVKIPQAYAFIFNNNPAPRSPRLYPTKANIGDNNAPTSERSANALAMVQ
tara:strand:+ start:249 stop:533 length:285 start_codon:yes stop_codon:yes gene_type:complete